MRKLVLTTLALVTVAGLTVAAAAGRSGSQSSPPAHDHSMHASAAPVPEGLAPLVAKARIATAKYATSLRRAQLDGYRVIVTRHLTDMGWHFLNPDIGGEFDVTKPPILVYVKRGQHWQLVAFEWVFTEQPATPPLPGATYGSFGAACHYEDGTFFFEPVQANCPATSPETGEQFAFWHPDFVTLHLWLWYPNPAGIYNGTNPLINPWNAG